MLGKRDRDEEGGAAASAHSDEQEESPDFLCPISQALMVDPVVAADGISYDRANIVQWWQQCDQQGRSRTFPSSNKIIETSKLFPNVALRARIEAAHTGSTKPVRVERVASQEIEEEEEVREEEEEYRISRIRFIRMEDVRNTDEFQSHLNSDEFRELCAAMITMRSMGATRPNLSRRLVEWGMSFTASSSGMLNHLLHVWQQSQGDAVPPWTPAELLALASSIPHRPSAWMPSLRARHPRLHQHQLLLSRISHGSPRSEASKRSWADSSLSRTKRTIF